MALFNTYRCPKCGSVWEGISEVCGRCGTLAARVGGIEACLSSGRPPGAARGRNDAHSARSIDRCMEANFKIMKITNCQHKEVNGAKVPVCTFAGRSPQGVYNNLPSYAQNQFGPTMPVRAFQSIGEMAKAGYGTPQLVSEGKPFQVPQVHPAVAVGAPVGRASGHLPGTQVVARSQGES